MNLLMIWAQARNGVIGNEGDIPWHLPEDLKHFKEVTMGRLVIMGRKTWESLPPQFRPLPGRENLILTRDTEWSVPRTIACHELDAVWPHIAAHQNNDFGCPVVIGGAEVYRAFMPWATGLVVTNVAVDVPGDAVAPAILESDGWQLTMSSGVKTSRTGLAYLIRHYSRSKTPSL